VQTGRLLPYMNSWHKKYHSQGLVVIGIHTPEFAEEGSRSSVKQAVKQLGIEYPIALDTTAKTWQAFDNRYWPATYLFDAQGKLVLKHYGEGDYAEIEQHIRSVLARTNSKLP